MSLWERIARTTVGDDYAGAYARRFRAMAERGEDPHGEAGLVQAVLGPPAQVLDAGCGTGRIAVRLHELGYDVVGVDVDAAMLREARAEAPHLEWLEADLTALDLGRCFDLVLLAGNVIPLLEPDTLRAAAQRLADHALPGAAVVCGFGLDAAHLPGDCPVTPLAAVDEAFAEAGLRAAERWSTWDRDPFTGGGYVVTVHRNDA